MIFERCPRCTAFLREVKTRNSFTKHAGCTSCKILYVMWGTCVTRCLTPIACAGDNWELLDAPPFQKGVSRPHGRKEAKK